MRENLHVGLTIGPSDPFWVEVREAIFEFAQQAGIEISSLELDPSVAYTLQEEIYAAEELISQDIHVIIDYGLSEKFIFEFLNSGGSVIFLNETAIKHPRFVSPRGLYEAGEIAGKYLASNVPQGGNILLIGPSETGYSRIQGFMQGIQSRPDLTIHQIETEWISAQVQSVVYEKLQGTALVYDGLYGLSDSVTLAGRNALAALELLSPEARVVGINGDPRALAAIVKQQMSATVMTSARKMGYRAVELSRQALLGEPLPDHYSYEPYLVTEKNVAEVAVQKLLDIAEIPGRLVGFNRQREQSRLRQLELTLDLNRHIGASILRAQLLKTVTDLFQTRLQFKEARFLVWDAPANNLWQEYPGTAHEKETPESPVWPAIETGQPVLLHTNEPIGSDNKITRLVIPVLQSEKIVGLLDLKSNELMHISRQQMLGFQILAGQLGIALQNAELYDEAVKARARAEQADRLKTRLLANVSHELRTPISVIIGFAQTALQTPGLYGIELPPDLNQDMNFILQSANHLLRLVNDLLDLSRAEVDLLQMNFETVDARPFLEETFATFLSSITLNPKVEWQLQLPARLPLLQIDRTRIRQVIFNLLSNASKFTSFGEIELGADVIPPYAHLWVKDTGGGIPVELQEKVFDPFFTAGQQYGKEGVGLGLTITRKLIALHHGYLSLESQVGEGTTFHMYLPLPGLDGQLLPVSTGHNPIMIVISHAREIAPSIAEIGRSNALDIQVVSDFSQLDAVLAEAQPKILAWNIADHSPEDWDLIQKIRLQPEACTIPFLMYQAGEDEPASQELLTVFSKPAPARTLLEHIEAIRPAETQVLFLVIDDDPQTCDYYAKILQHHFPGCEVVIAHDGEQGLEKLSMSRPSLIILDLAMPKMDGFEFLRHLKERPEARSIPVIVMSGKLLSREDVTRLQGANIVFELKQILSDDELVSQILSAKTGNSALHVETSTLVKQAIVYIFENFAADLSRNDLAQAMGISQGYLSRVFHREVGISPWEFLNRYRIIKAQEYLKKTNSGITSIALQVGFHDPAYFSRVFQKVAGCSPKIYRERFLNSSQ